MKYFHNKSQQKGLDNNDNDETHDEKGSKETIKTKEEIHSVEEISKLISYLMKCIFTL